MDINMDLFQWSINFLGGANYNFLVQLCKMMISPGLFLQIFIVQAVRGGWWGERRVKGQKIAQNEKITITSVTSHISGIV